MRRIDRRWSGAVAAALCGVWLVGWSAGARASTAPDPALELERLNGSWALDWNESDSFEPVMEALETPWLVRRLAGMIDVQINLAVEPPGCETCPPKLRVEQSNPIRSSKRTVALDGVARPGKDPLGNETLDRFSWSPDAGMEMVRERTLRSGKRARIHEKRRVEDDLRTMISLMTVWVDDVEQVQVRRVLRKVEP